jgi:hypothetical protein
VQSHSIVPTLDNRLFYPVLTPDDVIVGATDGVVKQATVKMATEWRVYVLAA